MSEQAAGGAVDLSGWTVVRPQRAEHRDGYAVGSHDRFEEKYEDERGRAILTVERSLPVTAVYGDSLAWEGENGERTPVSAGDRQVILDRIQAGMANLGVTTDLL